MMSTSALLQRCAQLLHLSISQIQLVRASAASEHHIAAFKHKYFSGLDRDLQTALEELSSAVAPICQ
jgi:hypothetical protein